MSDETKQAVEIITSRPGSIFTKTQNQRLAHVDSKALEGKQIHECFLPLDDNSRAIAKLLAGEKGLVKEVGELNFIYVQTDPALVQRLAQAGKLDSDQLDVVKTATVAPAV